MSIWQKIRPLFVATLALLALLVTSIAFISKTPVNRPLAAFDFPSDGPLQEWQSDSQFSEEYANGEKASGAKARYNNLQSDHSMKIEMRYAPDLRTQFVLDEHLMVKFLPSGFFALDCGMHYLVDIKGKMKSNIANSPLISSTVELQENPGAGYYCFWDDGRRLHLSASLCQGGRTVALRNQFAKVYAGQFTFSRIGEWLRGTAPLPDTRGVVVDLSINTSFARSAEDRKQLEAAWALWYPWLVAKFPPSDFSLPNDNYN